jgi:hypothetical protein
MGEIVADLELENFGDRVLQRRGYLPEEKVRQLMVKSVVDTGAVMLVLPQDVVGPPLGEPLIGHVILEELDLLADCQGRKLTPRPESPYYPLLKLK